MNNIISGTKEKVNITLNQIKNNINILGFEIDYLSSKIKLDNNKRLDEQFKIIYEFTENEQTDYTKLCLRYLNLL
jgi:hypothetical protein